MPKKIYLSEVMMPSQTNPSGNVHGGELMKMMDSTAYAAARKYCHANVVTVRVDELEFQSTSSKCRRTETSLPTQSIAPGA